MNTFTVSLEIEADMTAEEVEAAVKAALNEVPSVPYFDYSNVEVEEGE